MPDKIQNGDLWIYPSKDDVSLRGKEAITSYEFGLKQVRHLFCSTCGVSIGVVGKDDSIPVKPINVRTINGVDLDVLKVRKENGWSTREPPYEI